MIADAEVGLNNHRDPLRGPHLADEAVRLCSLREQPAQFGALLGSESRGRTRWGMPIQCGYASLAAALELLADCPTSRADGVPTPAGWWSSSCPAVYPITTLAISLGHVR